MTRKNSSKSNRKGPVARFFTSGYSFVWWLALVAGFLYVPTARAITLLSQGYLTNSQPPPGSIVSLQQNSTDHVEPATISNASNILGIVIDNGNSQLSLTSGQASQVQVATNGVVPVLVSDFNGKIAIGDSITASPISGVGMKATDNVKVVGVAQEAFPNATNSQQSYTDKKGVKHNVMLGQVPVQVNVAYYFKQPEKTLIPTALQNIANALAGKEVKTLPILVSIGIFFVTLVVVVSIIYTLIHSSIISVGRNPMAQSAIYRNVIQLSALVVVILGVAVVSIYLVLARL